MKSDEMRRNQVKGRELSGEEWLTVQEVAGLLKIDAETVRRWVKRGDLAALDLGSRKMGYRIRRSDLDAFIDARYQSKIAA